MIPSSRAAPPPAATPCVRVCTMHRLGFCIGCGRTLEEIGAWTSYSTDARAAAMQKLPARKAALARDYPL